MNAMWKPRMLGVAVLLLVALVGAPVAAAAQGPASPALTFTRDVAPILQRSCQVCHRPGSIAPMSLMTYEDVRPWARAIKRRTSAREMPPWYIDRHVGIRKFKEDPSLRDEEIDTIAKWVDAGAPKGNPADMPTPRSFEEVGLWHFEPDKIVTLPSDVIVPAEGPDEWKDIIVDAALAEDRYIRAIETKPSKGWQVVHHSVTRMIDPDGADNPEDFRGTFLNEYALGKNADIFPEGAGRLMKAGTKINFNLHLHSIGEATAANVELGLRFYPPGYVPKYVQETQGVGSNNDLDIPPNTDDVRAEGYFTLTKPARLLSFQPHMHNRGKAMCVEAIYPRTDDFAFAPNKVETISCVDRYQFAWHIVYHYAEEAQPLLPAGTVLKVTGWHNNTASNRFNPDPEQLVTYGQRTVDDMSFAWMQWYYLSEEEFKEQVEARKAKKTTN